MLSLWLACARDDGPPPPAPDSGRASTDSAAPELLEAHCGFEGCAEVPIAGDPVATLGPDPAPFRGYGDPSIATDDDGTAWMTYSWLDVVTDGVDADLAVRTHLARRDGDRWRYVRAVNEVVAVSHPITGAPGWTFSEVSTWTPRPDGTVEALWLEYFEGLGVADRSDFRFARSIADDPSHLGDAIEPAFRGPATPAVFGGVDLSAALPALADCATYTEPDLFTDGTETYLAVNCLVIDGATQDLPATRLVLLREDGDGWAFVGTLLDGDDSAALGADTLEQADVSRDRDGRWLLIVTPVRKAEDPQHQGCLGLTLTDLATASVAREDDGTPAVRMRLTGEGNLLGPGLCTHDAGLSEGVYLVLSSWDLTGPVPDISFSLRATGVTP